MLKQDIDYFAYHDLERNYRALLQAIYMHKPKTREKPLTEEAGIISTKKKTKSKGYSQDDIKEMARLREFGDHGKPMTYTDIGKLFNCTDHVVYGYLKRHGLLKKGLRGGDKPSLSHW